MVKSIKNWAEFEHELKSAGNHLVVVDFTATWCGPCRMIGPVFVKLSEEHKDVIFFKVDIDEAPDIAEKCGIQAMPTFKFYKHRQQIYEFSGADEKTLRAKVKEHK